MQRISVGMLVLLLATGCDRVEEPRSRTVHEAKPQGQPPQASPAHPTTSAAAPTAEQKPACVVPSPDVPPPPAPPATRCPPDPLTSPPDLPRAQVVFADAPGQPTVEVEVARSPAVRSRGLMYRKELPADAGMIFVWDNDQPRSFWMHNTCIPLDMLFIDRDGYIVGILEQVPTMNDLSRRNPCPARQVLELNAGYCREHGIRAGQKIKILEK